MSETTEDCVRKLFNLGCLPQNQHKLASYLFNRAKQLDQSEDSLEVTAEKSNIKTITELLIDVFKDHQELLSHQMNCDVTKYKKHCLKLHEIISRANALLISVPPRDF